MAKRIAVLGAGGIGGSIAAYLLRDGHDVAVIDQWSAHVDRIKSDGLKLTDPHGEFTVPAKALHLSEVSNLREQFDVVYLSVKTYDTPWATYLIEPYLKPTGVILPAQNALNDELVASIVGYPRTIGCVPSYSAAVYEPGHIVRTDPGATSAFTVGELSGAITPRVREVADALKAVGPSEATDNIWGARWSKLVVNCMANALSGLIGPAFSSLTQEQADLAGLIRVVAGSEVVRVALALGVEIEAISGIPAWQFAEATTADAVSAIKARLDEAAAWVKVTPEQRKRLGVPYRPSLLQDVIKGRRTEVDFLNGYVARKGEEISVPAPMNQAITALMKQVESGDIDPDPSNLRKLETYLVK